MSEIEHGTCFKCKKTGPVNRTYYDYDIKCSCCNGADDGHFEIVWHCKNCPPQPPASITVHVAPTNLRGPA